MREMMPPRKGTAVSRLLGSTVLKIMGWKIRGEFPAINKCVVIAAPHTSNWDFIVGMAARVKLGLDAHWLGKHTLFFWPLGSLLRWLGGFPVDRSAAHGTVDQAVGLFRTNEAMILGLSPEGTRKKVSKWKTGFYHIALKAGVPILPVTLDYATRTIEIASLLMPSGDLGKDLLEIGRLFSGARGKYPDQFSPPQPPGGGLQAPA